MAEDAPMAVAEAEVLDIETAATKVMEGKKLIDENPEKAVELLYQAVRAYEKRYGGSAIECAQVYMYYGIALFEVARSATDALGTTKTSVEPIAGQEPPDQADASAEAEAGSGDAGAATTTTATTSGAEGQAAVQDAPAQAEDGTAKPAAEAEPAPETAAASVNAEEDGAEGGEEEEEEEGQEDENEGGEEEEEGGAEGADVGGDCVTGAEDSSGDDMKLAWDMLELARIIYSKSEEPALHHDRLAEVHRALGDMKSEEERFEEAVECYKQSLHHLESMQPRNSRRIAEVQYMLARNLTFLDLPQEALQVTTATLTSLEQAVAETEERLAALPGDGSGGEAAEVEGRRLQAVSDDLRGVMAELHCNISGLKETIANDNSLKEALKQAFLKANAGTGSDGAAAGGGSAPASTTAAVTSSNAFSAPSKPASTAQAVSLGTVGRGSKRITLQPTSAPSAAVAPPAAPAGESGKPAEAGAAAEGSAPAAAAASGPAPTSKRTLEDLMGGASAAGGVLSAGFGAVAVVEATREEGGQAKKARTEAPATGGEVPVATTGGVAGAE